MNTWTIPSRIIAGFVAFFLITLLVGGLGLWGLVDMNKNVEVMATNTVPSIIKLNGIATNITDARRTVRQLVIDAASDEKVAEAAALALATIRQEGDRLGEEYRPLIFDDREKLLFDDARAARIEMFEAGEEIIATVREGNLEKAADLVRGRMDIADRKSAELIKRGIDYNAEVATGQAASASEKVRKSFLVIVSAVGLSLLLAGLVGISIVRTIIRALCSVSDALESSAAQTATASGQLSSVSQALAAGCSEQGSSVVQTSAALEQMQTMIRSTADNAQRAKELANQARTAAETGSRTMVTMNEAMNAIEVSSAEVAKIVKNIDEIAFQTNILALNAAVEAARAGEAGAGFAVVADEVRSLAQRSAAAARETADKIETAIASSRRGSASCSRVGESLGEIAEKVAAADSLVAEIATAAREQTHGIKQIGLAMTQMDGVTRGNAARAEESSSAATELNSQANLMQEGVEFLRSLVAAGGRTVSGASHPKISTAARYDVSEGRSVRPASRVAASQMALPLPSAGRIPMPGDMVASADNEDRNFKNF